MGRRARRYQVTGYIVCGPLLADYRPGRDALIAACEAYGPGTLVHPTYGTCQVNCDTYAVTETRERGGIAMFEMVFSEAGALDEDGAVPDQAAVSASAAAAGMQAAAQGLDNAVQSSLAATNGAVAS